MRKLASIQVIKDLRPIEGADAIEVASILGWHVVVKKNEFQIGDMIVYVEIDSMLPERPEFEFVRARANRVKTIRLRGQVSQGVCFGLGIMPEGFVPEIDCDCTELLNILKYDPPMPANLNGIAKGKFPSFMPKTDETRVQNLQNLLDKYKGERCYIAEKLDGSSATYYIKDGEFGVCSRNLELLPDQENSYWTFAIDNDLENKLRKLNMNISIQGEIIGEGIQSNKYKIKGCSVRFFNAFDIDKYEYLFYDEFVKLMGDMELMIVPILDENYILENDIDAIVKRSQIRSVLNKDAWAEGIVIRPIAEKSDTLISTEDYNKGRVSFKAINPEFLLKYGD
jgi:RNA ligase (TIGR02306 family)